MSPSPNRKWNVHRKQAKYRAIPTEVDGIRFASKREAKRYQELKWLEQDGKISRLELQPRFPIFIKGIKVCVYVADFRYLQGRWWIEDVKGVKTPIYRLKKKMFEAYYGMKITEV